MDQKDAAAKKRKSLGIPEVDPDALPSAQVTTYLTFSCRRMMYSKDCNWTRYSQRTLLQVTNLIRYSKSFTLFFQGRLSPNVWRRSKSSKASFKVMIWPRCRNGFLKVSNGCPKPFLVLPNLVLTSTLRLQAAISDIGVSLEGIHKQISDEYSTGVIKGYPKASLGETKNVACTPMAFL